MVAMLLTMLLQLLSTCARAGRAALTVPGSTPPSRFHLYAPHASTVVVKPAGGRLTDWTAQPMAKDPSAPGFWNATVFGMCAGDGYVFAVDGTERVDPSCLDISVDGSHSVVPQTYYWRHPRRIVPWQHAIFYELQVGSFTTEGTLAAAATKLPYLAQLGITVVELMPVMHFCGPADSWGYCPVAPYAVRPELGGSYGLKAFVDAAAGFNISVALDIVWNHAASSSVLVNYDQPSAGNHCDNEEGECGIFFAQGPAELTPWGPRPNMADPNIRDWIVRSVEGLIDDFHVGSFRWDSTACIRQVGGKIGDGRCDTDNRDGWLLMQEANTMAHSSAQRGTIVVAEDTWGTPYPAITAAVNDTSAQTPAGTSGGAGFDAQWGYPFYFAASGEVTKARNDEIDVKLLMEACLGLAGQDPSKFVIFSENHDISSNQAHSGITGRIPHRIDSRTTPGGNCSAAVNRVDCGMTVGKDQASCEAAGCCWSASPDPNPSHVPWCFKKPGIPIPPTGQDPKRYWAEKKSMLLLGMVLTCPGAPMLLQGQELLTYDSFNFPTPPKLDWSLVDSNAGMLRETRDMIALRSNRYGKSFGLLGGSGRVLDITDPSGVEKVGVIHRFSSGQGPSNDVITVYNFQNHTLPSFLLSGVPYDGAWSIRFNGDWKGYSNLYEDRCALGSGTDSQVVQVKVDRGRGTLCVPPMSMLVVTRA